MGSRASVKFKNPCWHIPDVLQRPRLIRKKTTYALITPSIVGLTFVSLCRFLNSYGNWHISVSVTSWLPLHYYDPWHLTENVFWPGDLDLGPWPRYPSTWPTCQNSSLYVCPFGYESETDRLTHTLPKLLHPSLTRGVTIKTKKAISRFTAGGGFDLETCL